MRHLRSAGIGGGKLQVSSHLKDLVVVRQSKPTVGDNVR